MTKRTRYFMAVSAGIVVVGLGSGLVAYYGGGFPALSASLIRTDVGRSRSVATELTIHAPGRLLPAFA